MNQEQRLINGELLRLRREAQGWVITDMALRACLSVKQVRQLEDGGTSAFYSESVKLTAAKKVGGLLGLSADEVFVSSVAPTVEANLPVQEIATDNVQTETAETKDDSKLGLVNEIAAATQSASTPVEALPASEEVKPKTSLWLITSLFAAALAVAAYLQPKEEAPVEAAPPLQVVPSEADSTASAAETAASSAASAASEPVVAPAVAQKPASTAMVPASAAVPAASAASKAH